MSTEPSILGGQLRVLVVSQSLELSRLVRSSLAHEACLESDVTDCESTDAARAYLDGQAVDLIVLSGGLDEVRGLVEWATDAALVALTPAETAEDHASIVAAGATECLSLANFDGRSDLLWSSLRQTIRYHAIRLHHRRLKQTLQDRARHISRLTTRLARSAPFDSRTGWFSHAHTVDRCQEEIGRAVRYGLSLSLVLLDVVGLDRLEAEHGEAVVDEVVTQIAARIRLISRHTDIAGHYGPESFVVILTNTDGEGAQMFCRRADMALSSPIVVGGVSATLEWCFAVVTRTGHCKSSPTDLLNTLEHRIERAKETRAKGVIVAD